MSLLLDALKRAEQEKLARQGGTPAGDRAPGLANAASAPAAAFAKAAAASLELQPISPGAAPSAAPSREAQAAQNVFQAKESAPAKAAAAPGTAKKGPFLWIAIGVIVVVVLGAGGYVWYTVNSFSVRSLASARPHPTTIGPITSITPGPGPVEPQQNGSATPKVESVAPTQQPSTAIQPGAQPAAAPASPPMAGAAKPAGSQLSEGERVREAVAALLKESSKPDTTPPLKLSPSREAPTVSPEVARGYRALMAGDLAAAHKSYAAALDADPANLDALLGIATIEARTGNRMLAALHYRKALEVNPRDATALAGLASIAEFASADSAESRLRADLTINPGSAALHFTLGNLFATQARWGEAQVEYFEAYRIEPASADYAYNLAVSLDHMKQPKLAAEYYARALDAARSQATQFDPQAVARRLAQLKG
ncbi:MAG TPA: tetratricopeptide repeat protein [Usitatibacter sp.]|nr:tetratricopeptide repeat protein [Usitatibacter sp.]